MATVEYLVDVHTGRTLTDLLAHTARPAVSMILTFSVYAPAMEKVATEYFEAFFSLLLKLTLAPLGAEVTDQV